MGPSQSRRARASGTVETAAMRVLLPAQGDRRGSGVGRAIGYLGRVTGTPLLRVPEDSSGCRLSGSSLKTGSKDHEKGGSPGYVPEEAAVKTG